MLNKDSLEKILLKEIGSMGNISEEFKQGFEACLSLICKMFDLKK